MRLCAGRLAAACMCIFVGFSAAGSEGPRWLKIQSPSFELFTTAGECNGREVARHFEQVRAFFLEAMGLGLKSRPAVRIVVFRSDKEFAPYAPNDFVAAFYLGAEDRDYIVMKSAASEHFPVAVHEYVHLLVKHTGNTAPVWFNEGLAELYSNLKPLAAKIEVGDIITQHFILLQQSKWIDLARLWPCSTTRPCTTRTTMPGCSTPSVGAGPHVIPGRGLPAEVTTFARRHQEQRRLDGHVPEGVRQAAGAGAERSCILHAQDEL